MNASKSECTLNVFRFLPILYFIFILTGPGLKQNRPSKKQIFSYNFSLHNIAYNHMQMFIISALTGDIVFREREWVSYSQGQKRGACMGSPIVRVGYH